MVLIADDTSQLVRRDPASIMSGDLPPVHGGYIAFEGIDGSGKSTLSRAAADLLLNAGDACTIIGRHAWLDVTTTRILVALMRPGELPSRSRIVEAFDTDSELLWTHAIQPALAIGHVLQDRSL